MLDPRQREDLETRLASETYDVVDRELRELQSEDLLVLLDSRSNTIGDTAADLLGSRKETSLIIDAVINNRIRTALGRVRATNVLASFGRSIPEATDAYVHSLNDRSENVVGNGLFGIVFMRRRDLLPKLQEHLASAPPGTTRHRLFREAIEALEANNPSLFSPGFLDVHDVWRLNDNV